MGLVKGTIWNIFTLIIGLKLVLVSYNIELFRGLDMVIIGGIFVVISVWFLISRAILGPRA